MPSQPTVDGVDLRASNGESWIRCRPLLPNGPPPTITATPVGTHRASYSYRGNDQLTLVHLLELGDGEASGRTTTVNVSQTKEVVEVALTGKRFIFARQRPFGVSGR